MSGQNISIFYLHTGTKHSVDRFNQDFLSKLELGDQAAPPCVVFFKFNTEGFFDFSVQAVTESN